MKVTPKMIARLKKEILDYTDYQKGFAYVKWSKKKQKYRIALSKKTYWIRKWKKKKGIPLS